MIIQKQRDMTVTVTKTRHNHKPYSNGQKMICLNQGDGFHCQCALLTRKQAEKLAKYLTRN